MFFFVFHVNQDRQQDNEKCTNHGQGADIKPKQIHGVSENKIIPHFTYMYSFLSFA